MRQFSASGLFQFESLCPKRVWDWNFHFIKILAQIIIKISNFLAKPKRILIYAEMVKVLPKWIALSFYAQIWSCLECHIPNIQASARLSPSREPLPYS
jgi:hypothetical protein